MSNANWVVTTATERVVLDRQGQGRTTFTVTNPRESRDEAVLDLVPDGDTDPAWLTVDEPQRPVNPGASVAYQVTVVVPPEAPAGDYTFQARAYSADSAPEETFGLSPRVVLVIPADAEPGRAVRRLPWWVLAAAAGLVAVVLVVVGVLVFGGGDDPAAGPPPPSAGPDEVVTPDLVGMTEADAVATLDDLGLTLEPIQYRSNVAPADPADPASPGGVISQSIQADTVVAQDSLIALVVGVELVAPVLTGPPAYPAPDGVPQPVTLTWERGPSYQRSWLVHLQLEMCRAVWQESPYGVMRLNCTWVAAPIGFVDVDVPRYAPDFSWLVLDSAGVSLPLNPIAVAYTDFLHTGMVRWQVTPLDDFGIPGPTSEGVFRLDLAS